MWGFMDDRKKLTGRALVLKENPFCIYCGSEVGPTGTTDHCPPRCFFIDRHWPETFEFSCFRKCNDIARKDEAALAVLVRIRVGQSDMALQEWQRLADALRINQPQYIQEWFSLKRNEVRRSLRDSFGGAGDTMRSSGWSVLNIGPLTDALIERFLQRLATALYYYRNKKRFIGVVHYIRQNSYMSGFDTDKFWKVLGHAPEIVPTERNTKDLSDQFTFRCNYSPDVGVLLAVVTFSPQLIFTICAFESRAIDGLNELRRSEVLPELPSDVGKIYDLIPFI